MVFPRSLAVELPGHRTSVGRAWLKQAGVVDPKVSNEHLRFHSQGGHFGVEDLGSRNGTFVDGERLEKGVCSAWNGAVIRVGRTVFVYRDRFAGNVDPDPPLGDLVGPFGLRDLAALVGDMERTVAGRAERILIQAESGAGKELLAAELARRLRPGGKVAHVNVTAIPATTFDSYLFGHMRGAFTGATSDAPGIFKAHRGGMVVLDEIGELPLELQPKLLRFLDHGEIQPLGSTRTENVDVLVIGSTNRPLDAAVGSGGFRKDLLARFTWRVTIPPLCDRTEDIFAIASAGAHRKLGRGFDPDYVDAVAVERLLLHGWAGGNVRELWRCVELAATRAALPTLTDEAVTYALGHLHGSERPRTSLTIASAQAALKAAGEDQSKAARLLGVDRGLLLRKLARARER